MNNDLKIILLEKQNAMLELQNSILQANLDYVSMMADIEIPTEEDDDGAFGNV